MVNVTFAPASAAAETLARIKGKALMLGGALGVGRPRNELLPSLRSFAVGPYVIFYRRIADGVQIVRVLHDRRDIDAILSEPEA